MPEGFRGKRKVILVCLLSVLLLGAECKKPKEKKRISPAGVIHESYTIMLKGYRGEVTVKAGIEDLFSYTIEPGNVSFLGGKIFKPVSETPPDITDVGRAIVLEANILSENFNLVILPAKLVDEPDRKEIWMIIFGKISGVARIKMTPDGENTRLIQDIYIELPDSAMVSMAEQLGVDEQLCRGFDKGLARVQAHFDPCLDPEELLSHGLRGEMYETIFQVHEASVRVNVPPGDFIRDMLNPDNIDVFTFAQVEGLGECINEPEKRRRWESEGSEEPVFCPVIVKLAGFEWQADTFTIIKPKNSREFFTVYVVAHVVLQMKVVAQQEQQGTRVRMIIAIEPPGSATPNLIDAFVTLSGLPRWMEKVLLDIKARVEGVG